MTAINNISAPDQPVRVLLAEDSEINQKIVRLMLEKHGFHVTVAADGRQAVTACEHRRYDLILMDISMPVMDGYGAARAIRAGESGAQRVPIIAMSGHAAESIRNRCLEHGMDDCIGKPLQREQLLAVVKKWTDARPDGERFEADPRIPAPPPPPAGAPLDLNRAAKEFMGRTDVLFELLNGFVAGTRDQIHIIDQAVASNDEKTVAAQAHCIKGAAANLTADPLAETAAELEKAAGRLPPGQWVPLVEKLEMQLRQLERFIRQTGCQIPVREQNEDFDR